MTKHELASYLVNLHTLLEAQDKNGLLKSALLTNEYDKNWDLLKDAIAKENDNARKSNDQRSSESKDRADLTRG